MKKNDYKRFVNRAAKAKLDKVPHALTDAQEANMRIVNDVVMAEVNLRIARRKEMDG